MGEVYRAHDSKLGRDVAIKILPRQFAADADRRGRLEREARLLATLNHPHIGSIYGVEDREGVLALVLELVEGDTLAERIASATPWIRRRLKLESVFSRDMGHAHHMLVDIAPGHGKLEGKTVLTLHFGTLYLAGVLP